MPKFEDWIVQRIYQCLACKAEIAFEDKASRDFRKRCPLCRKNELVIKSGSCGITTVVDLTMAKTFGSVSEKNIRRRADETGELPEKAKRPFWRKKDSINFKVLKEPAKYITTGKT